MRGWRGELKRYGAPAAFLAAVTIAVLLVRSGLETRSSPGTTTVATTRATSNPTPTTVVKRPRFYRLRTGETLSDVAIRFDTTVEELLALNPGIEPTNLEVGRRIRVK
ncbi:MAG: LysM peptidoglycan-binding domain-containing protein [Actinomycetota bacterium]|nr:LysM peptidoglycan-binding domain-containing protein [Actinomycetota bacterium]